MAQLSHRYASDTRNAPENCGVPRPMSICGAKNHCPFRGHLALTGSTLMCWRRCSRNAVRTVGRRKSRLDHRFSLGALQSELPPPWHVWCLNRSAPHNALISSHIFSSGGKVGYGRSSAIRTIHMSIEAPNDQTWTIGPKVVSYRLTLALTGMRAGLAAAARAKEGSDTCRRKHRLVSDGVTIFRCRPMSPTSKPGPKFQNASAGGY